MKKSIWVSAIVSQGLFVLSLPFLYPLFSYLHPIVIVVMWICMTSLVTFFVFLWNKTVIPIPYSIFTTLLSLYALCLLVLLFFRPSNQSYDSWNLIPFQTIGYYFSNHVSPFIAFYNLAANIGLFLPFGFFITIVNKNKWLSFLCSVCSILAIETMQHLTHRGSFDVDDIILNVLGIYVGVLLFPIFHKVVHIKKSIV